MGLEKLSLEMRKAPRKPWKPNADRKFPVRLNDMLSRCVSEPGNCIMTATAKRTRLADRMRTPQSKPRLRTVKSRLLDFDPTQLNRAVRTTNQADKRDNWFDFLRNV